MARPCGQWQHSAAAILLMSSLAFAYVDRLPPDELSDPWLEWCLNPRKEPWFSTRRVLLEDITLFHMRAGTLGPVDTNQRIVAASKTTKFLPGMVVIEMMNRKLEMNPLARNDPLFILENGTSQCLLGAVAVLALAELSRQYRGDSGAGPSADWLSGYRALRTVIQRVGIITGDASIFRASYGGMRPVQLMNEVSLIGMRVVFGLLNMQVDATTGGSLRWARSRGLPEDIAERRFLDADSAEQRRAWLQRRMRKIAICVRHEAGSPLVLLRNAVESLSTSELLGAGVALTVVIEQCGVWWKEPTAAEGWYLEWLRKRFDARTVCLDSDNVETDRDACFMEDMHRSGIEAVVRLTSKWHMLPFHLDHILERLSGGFDLLQDGAAVAVSFSEKCLHSLSGLRGRSSFLIHNANLEPEDLVDSRDVVNLAYTVPVLTGAWNMSAAAETFRRIFTLAASVPSPRSLTSSESVLELAKTAGVIVCGTHKHFLCLPERFWVGFGAPARDSSRGSEDVWMLPLPVGRQRSGKAPTSRQEHAAFSFGLFQPSRGGSYSSEPEATSLGIPDCAACHAVPQKEPFTIYITSLEQLGPCRELFGSLLMDVLEILNLASFQGPGTVIVEPMIPNVVRHPFTEADAKKQRSSGKADEKEEDFISRVWRGDNCRLRHGSLVPFSELFDWSSFVSWLKATRGVGGAVNWNTFLAKADHTLDLALMNMEHMGGNPPHGDLTDRPSTPCKTGDGPLTLRFLEEDFTVKRLACVHKDDHEGSMQWFLNDEMISRELLNAVEKAKKEGRSSVSVGFFLAMISGPERARMLPTNYQSFSRHGLHTSLWSGLRLEPSILEDAERAMIELGLQKKYYLSVHWRYGDTDSPMFSHDPNRRLQGAGSKPVNFVGNIQTYARMRRVSTVFLMTHSSERSRRELAALAPELTFVWLPAEPDTANAAEQERRDRDSLRRLMLEVAIASRADYFVAFGNGAMTGHISKPSFLVLALRRFVEGYPIESNAFAFADRTAFDPLGL
eukprot:TRINITY_DN38019_c0_g1_i1.p1 TRINITY_DN38019_c0_g1~~TRINITY_DN38019_c0_g1_i1.p1  ORF type:complete len:1015 (+),score=127.25 TRINITY_DN38019_c0_g1_i1:75-3119(+)